MLQTHNQGNFKGEKRGPFSYAKKKKFKESKKKKEHPLKNHIVLPKKKEKVDI